LDIALDHRPHQALGLADGQILECMDHVESGVVHRCALIWRRRRAGTARPLISQLRKPVTREMVRPFNFGAVRRRDMAPPAASLRQWINRFATPRAYQRRIWPSA